MTICNRSSRARAHTRTLTVENFNWNEESRLFVLFLFFSICVFLFHICCFFSCDRVCSFYLFFSEEQWTLTLWRERAYVRGCTCICVCVHASRARASSTFSIGRFCLSSSSPYVMVVHCTIEHRPANGEKYEKNVMYYNVRGIFVVLLVFFLILSSVFTYTFFSSPSHFLKHFFVCLLFFSLIRIVAVL